MRRPTRLRQYFFNGTVRNFRVIVPDLGTVEGPFQIATLEYGGQHDGEVTFDLSLESAGALSFTPAA
jgi:TP901-1 family phage major tail protein